MRKIQFFFKKELTVSFTKGKKRAFNGKFELFIIMYTLRIHTIQNSIKKCPNVHSFTKIIIYSFCMGLSRTAFRYRCIIFQ